MMLIRIYHLWWAQDVHDEVTISFGSSKYSAGDATTAHEHLTTAVPTGHGWIITDGGQEV